MGIEVNKKYILQQEFKFAEPRIYEGATARSQIGSLGKRSHANRLLYRRRMWTEEMHDDLQGHDFDLKATHLDDQARIACLVLAACIAFVWLTVLGS